MVEKYTCQMDHALLWPGATSERLGRPGMHEDYRFPWPCHYCRRDTKRPHFFSTISGNTFDFLKCHTGWRL